MLCYGFNVKVIDFFEENMMMIMKIKVKMMKIKVNNLKVIEFFEENKANFSSSGTLSWVPHASLKFDFFLFL